MSTALRAVDLHASHAIAAVGRRADRAFNRLEKAGQPVPLSNFVSDVKSGCHSQRT
jgi:hypothetical protein